MKQSKKDKPKITKEQLKYNEWEKYNKEYQQKTSKDANPMYDGLVKGNKWGW